MTTENTTERRGRHAVLTNVRDEFIDERYETFNDAVDAMMDKWRMLTVQERVEIAKSDYCDILGSPYMMAVGFYNEETGEAWESMTLAEAIEARNKKEDE